MADPPDNILTIPLKVDAFVFNEPVCDGSPKDAKIAPITQPNYTFLQLDDTLLQPDILDHVDLHNSIPKESNPRLNDLGRSQVRTNRLGVYVHWVMPRFYRSGVAATPSAGGGAQGDRQKHRRKRGLRDAEGDDPAVPAFRPLPNRWLVIRQLDPDADTTEPRGAPIPPVEAWVLESDRLRSIDDADLATADLQVDVSPYIKANAKAGDDINLAEQAEAFIGYRQAAGDWKEDPSCPRVDLSAISSSNQLFLDYQPHCSNVFSLVDTFAYGPDDTRQSLVRAKANYYVVGWHSNADDGPFGQLDEDQTRGDRFNLLSMAWNDATLPSEVEDWLQPTTTGPVLCHGAMYGVAWDANQTPANMPANDVAHQLLDAMPVAVGTTPIDAILAYIDTHHETDIAQDLRILGPLLRAQDEGVAAQRIATDEMQNWNFSREAGGKHWHFQLPRDQPVQPPSDDQAGNLEALNQMQAMLDGVTRQLVKLRWEMFAYWWRYVSVPDPTNLPFGEHDIQDLESRLKGLAQSQASLQDQVTQISTDPTVFSQAPESGVLAEFFQPRDPTLLVGGIQAGWPDDYLDPLLVRLSTQLVPPADGDNPLDLQLHGISALPANLQDAATGLVQEFLTLGQEDSPNLPDGHWLPLYHDAGKHGDGANRDQWADSQPWAPLFLGWEAEYFHVPWPDYWAMAPDNTQQLLDPRWQLQIAPDKDLQQLPLTDTRTISGRILLLPQPSFSLQATIDQLFSSMDPDVLNQYLTPDQQEAVKTETYQLPFLSAPLDGFSDHLLTMAQGTHIKPLARVPSCGLQAIPDAVIAAFTAARLQLIDINSEKTPYGTLIRLAQSNPDAPEGLIPCPFKPVTHGQFRFAKVNVVDKFGQAISAIDPRYGHEEDEAVYPQLSDYFAPQVRDGHPNTVVPPGPDQAAHNEFIQVPPGINQPARLNAAFVVHDPRQETDPDNYAYWRPVTEWENPIWGWMVLNYADYGIQFFLPDGTFYREVRLASPTAPRHTATSAKWLPFQQTDPPPNTGQLDHLIDKLSQADQTYLLDLLAMTNTSLDNSASAPSAYASFLNTLVGRPLALVNAGWSLELSMDERTIQAQVDPATTESSPDVTLLPSPKTPQYAFPLKLGDFDRERDGLAGFFATKTTSSGLSPADELDLDTIYTYYPNDDPSPNTPLQRILPPNLPTLSPFWLDPLSYTTQPSLSQQAQQYAKDWNSQFTVFGTIIDPFTPITAYTSILPINALQLPTWTWESAMQKMTVFFHLGPVVVPDDVEAYRDSTATLKGDYKLDPPEEDQTVSGSAVAIPALATGDWAWLQPYDEEGKQEPSYEALGLGTLDKGPKYQPGPYTALEGYLQLKAPIIKESEDSQDTDSSST